MTTYLLPCYSKQDGCWIEKVRANSFNDAMSKFLNILSNDYDLGYPCDWEDLTISLKEVDVLIGDIYDIEEF